MRPFAGGAAAALWSGECSASCRACDAASSSIARWQQSLRSWVATQQWSIDPPQLHRQRVKLLGIVDAGVRRPHLQPRREATAYTDARAALASASQQQLHKAQLPVEQRLPAARQRRKTHLRQVAPHFGLQVHGDVTFLRAAEKPPTDVGPASQHALPAGACSEPTTHLQPPASAPPHPQPALQHRCLPAGSASNHNMPPGGGSCGAPH